MKPVTLGCCLALVGAASSASAQSKRIFPDAKCSYTLPGPGWEWVDVRGARFPGGDTLAQVRGPAGLVFTLQTDPLRGGTPDRRSYQSFKAGLTSTGQVKAVGSRHLIFQGVPSYHIDTESAAGNHGAIRAIFANDRFYHLQVIKRGTPPTDDEAAAAFGGFEFVGPPKAMLPPDDGTDEETEGRVRAGLKLGVGLDTLGPGGMVLLIIFAAWVLIRMRG
jgi:hypothetical protein